jgi:hypothetical protein
VIAVVAELRSRVVRRDDEQVDVVSLAVELVQLGTEVCAHVPHDLLAAGQDRVGERPCRYFATKTR